jgi:hypothetical protein
MYGLLIIVFEATTLKSLCLVSFLGKQNQKYTAEDLHPRLETKPLYMATGAAVGCNSFF